jgi:uncharacterized protein (DUF433 family)
MQVASFALDAPLCFRDRRFAMTEATNIIRFFGADHVQRLTGLSAFQLREWDKAGFFAPQYAYENRRVASGRVYSFQDLVGLRTLAVLSKKHRISLSELKKTAKSLSQWSHTPWSSLTLYVVNREVHFQNPKTGDIEGAITGQRTVAIPLEDVMADMRVEAGRLAKRPQESIGNVDRRKFRMHNAWCIAGTRIPVSAIYNFTDAGYGPKQIVEQYPDLTIKDVKAALLRRLELTQAA